MAILVAKPMVVGWVRAGYSLPDILVCDTIHRFINNLIVFTGCGPGVLPACPGKKP
jgi:hypothetical protein